MTRQESIEALNVSLTNVIDEWANDECRRPAWDTVGYVGNELSRLMAKAAIAVLEASADVQDWLKDQGEMK